MPDDSSTADVAIAHLASGSADDLAAATRAAIDAGRAGIDAVRSRDAGTGEKLGDIDVLDAYDEAMATLSYISNIANLVSKAHPDAGVRAAADEATQAISKEMTNISLDPEVYAALSALDIGDEDAATRHFLDKTLRGFRRSGVDRDEATRARVRELEEAIVATGLEFGRNIQTDTRTGRFPPSALDGLPEDYVRAHPAGEDGLVAITTEYPDLIPFSTYATDGTAREQMWRLGRLRAYPANVTVLRELIERRHQLATLLGYRNWAQYVTEDKMIGTDTAAGDFIDRISELSGRRATADYAELLERKRVDEPDAEVVWPWDVQFLQDRRKSEKLAFDTQMVRPYFEYVRTKAGLMAIVENMFGITFARRDDIPTWHEDVEVHDVRQAADGTVLGRIYLDMHPRTDKYKHAAMFGMRSGKSSPTHDRLPHGALVCNLPKPGAEPALLQHTDVTTFFHEFGHLVHYVLGGRQRWAGLSGVRTEWDFVEAPSQLLEEWTIDAGMLATFAVHHETGEPLPTAMVAKLREADEFGKGIFVRMQMSYAQTSLDLYRSDPAVLDVDAVCRAATARHLPFPLVDGVYQQMSFGHLDGYSAMYYTYMWSLVIAKDMFTRFAAEGLPAPEASAAYRDSVLARGGSAPAADLVRDFLGREYTFDAYQAWLDA